MVFVEGAVGGGGGAVVNAVKVGADAAGIRVSGGACVGGNAADCWFELESSSRGQVIIGRVGQPLVWIPKQESSAADFSCN